MFMVASSVVTTIMILNYHHRQADTHEMPSWVNISIQFSRDQNPSISDTILLNKTTLIPNFLSSFRDFKFHYENSAPVTAGR